MAEEEDKPGNTGHHWERLSGHDFREDIPPSFEWWRKFVYEPAHQEVVIQMDRNRRELILEMEVAKKKVDGTMRLLWGLLVVTLSGMAGIIGILLSHQITAH